MNKIKYEKMINEKLATLKEELIEELMQEFEEEQKNEFPKLEDEYWYISPSGEAYRDVWDDFTAERMILEIGNVFKTREEAEFEVERRKVIAELKKYAEPKDREWDGDNKHWSIGYKHSRQDLDYCASYYTSYGEFYFESKEKAEVAVKMIGEDRIKKYYLEVE